MRLSDQDLLLKMCYQDVKMNSTSEASFTDINLSTSMKRLLHPL